MLLDCYELTDNRANALDSRVSMLTTYIAPPDMKMENMSPKRAGSVPRHVEQEASPFLRRRGYFCIALILVQLESRMQRSRIEKRILWMLLQGFNVSFQVFCFNFFILKRETDGQLQQTNLHSALCRDAINIAGNRSIQYR
jgi:hypothetical protein